MAGGEGEKSVGQWVGAIVGAVVGWFVAGNPYYGAVVGAGLGGAVGGLIDPPKGPTITGPRLQDLSVQTSTFGAPLARIYGTVGLFGNVIWVENNALKEVVRKKKQGGKGGGGGTTVKTYTYFATFAVSLCDAPPTGIAGIKRVWIASDLIYNSASTDLATIIASNSTTIYLPLEFGGAIEIPSGLYGNNGVRFNVYPGTDDQEPDPRIEAEMGVGNAPAFRGTAYIIFYDLPLEKYGNSLMGAQVKVEVMQSAGSNTDVIETLYLRPDSDLVANTIDGSCIFFNEGVSTFYFPEWTSSYGANTNMRKITRYPGYSVQTRVTLPFNGSLMTNGYSDIDAYLLDRQGIRAFYIDEKYYYMQGTDAQVTSTTGSFCYVAGELFIANFSSEVIHKLGEQAIGTTTSSITNSSSAYTGLCGVAADDTASVVYALYTSGIAVLSGDDLSEVELLSITLSLPSSASTCRFVYESGLLWVFAGATAGSIVYSINPDDGAIVSEFSVSFDAAFDNNLLIDAGVVAETNGKESPQSYHLRYSALSVATSNTVELSDIVEAELIRSENITAADINVALLTDNVRGYRIAGVQQIRSCIGPLQNAYPFDLIPSGYKIKAVPRGQASVMTIPIEDLDARPYGEQAKPALSSTREMDTQLPRQVVLRHLDAVREYDINEQRSPERASAKSASVEEVELALVLSPDEAADVVEMMFSRWWLEAREPKTFRLPPTYLALEPSDVVTVTTSYGTFELRIEHIQYLTNGCLEVRTRPNAAAIYSPNAAGGEGVTPADTVSLPGSTVSALLDLPLVRNADDQYGFAAALAGTSAGWLGGVLFRSADNEQSWQDIQAFSGPVTMGSARTALADYDCFVIDRDSTLQVDLFAGELESITESQMMTGLNWCAYGADGRWELLRFATATLQADGSYILSTLLRGLRGSEWTAGLHEYGDTFVLLDDSDLAAVGADAADIAITRQWRAVTVGASIDSAATFDFAYQGVNLKPLSGVYAEAAYSTDWTITWSPRTRLQGSLWKTGIALPAGEDVESYEIDIIDTTVSPGVVTRTLSVSTNSATYTAAQIAEDFGSPAPTVLTVKIYQLSADVGRGRALEATFTA